MAVFSTQLAATTGHVSGTRGAAAGNSPPGLINKMVRNLVSKISAAWSATGRAYLRANDKTLFAQVRRGGFVLGRHYQLPEP